MCGQKKVAKEKATPGSVPAAPVPCATRGWRGLRNSPLRGSDSPRPLSASACVARHLPRGPVNRKDDCGRRQKRGKNQISARAYRSCTPLSPGWFTGPLERCRATQAGADKGRALFEGEARVAQPPRLPSSAGNRRSRHRPRVAFSLLTFFWRSKRK